MLKIAWWCVLTLLATGVQARDAQVVDVEFKYLRGGVWQVSTLVNHENSSWTDFADRWRVISEDGKVFGEKFLNPDKVSLGDYDKTAIVVEIPSTVDRVIVEAHDSVNGWRQELSVAVDLNRREGPRYRVRR